MSELSHQPCPNCSSSDAFSYNTEKMVGKCYSCDNPYPMKGKRYDEETLGRYPLMQKLPQRGATEDVFDAPDPHLGSKRVFLASRGISAKTMEHWNVHTVLNNAGKPVAQEYVYPNGGKKIRQFPKDFRAEGLKTDQFFGQNLFPAGCAKMLTITEGELDALSVWQMLGGANKLNPVVSLPSANPSGDIWTKHREWLNSFSKIVVSVDNDEAGNKLAAKINTMFPQKVFRVDHGEYKDANGMLQAGKEQLFTKSWWEVPRYTPDNILHSAEDLLNLYSDTPNHSFVPTGIQDFDDKAMGLMQGHFTVFKAPTGIGKTELMRYLEWQLLKQGVPFAAWHLEETKLRSLLGLVSYHRQDNLTRKDLVEAKGRDTDVRESIKHIASTGNFYQFFLREDEGHEDLLAQIRMMKEAYEVKFVLFEPIQDVVTSSGDNKEAELANLSVKLSKLAAEIGVGIVTIAHTNDDGEMKYCRMIGQRASVVVRLDRDKEADGEEKNHTRLIIEKNRPTSEEGLAGTMVFDLDTFTMAERPYV